ncbi:hypothetical protein ACKTEK_03170 [Tepidamorphus sp. 3E244]|uniref:hypothetical protein n=1 Tax=Tepidamorphus sp. 3E244 TaxID=3385498 RepID=UPI0038FC8DED
MKAAIAISVALATTLTWPAEAGRLGDFGRPEPSVVTGAILPWIGNKLAARRGEPVSRFQLTDWEMELRARAYSMFMPMHRLHFFARHRAELVRTRVWPDEKYRIHVASYYTALRAQGFISTPARYNALEQAIRADLALIEPFIVTAERVYADDRRRMDALRASAAAHELGVDAEARIYENRRVTDWAVIAMQWRVEAYIFALDTTRIEMPSVRAVDVEMALRRLSAAVDIMAASIDRMEADLLIEGHLPPDVPPGPIDLQGPVYKR